VYLHLPMKSMPITTKIMSLIPVYAEGYSIQLHVITLVSDLQ